MINIEGLDKGAVLAALFNAAKVRGRGFYHATDRVMTADQGRKTLERLKGGLFIDYLEGRVLKVDLTGDSFDPWLYDRDNGEGAAARALEDM
jgi:hypothetical protein